jgi:hypothetical protein
MSHTLSPEIDASDITERLVGITQICLQNFVSRGLYGLRASVVAGKVRAQRRLFSRDDVFGIALVWLLFESGLRGDPLARVLNDIAGTKKANANLAAKKLLESGSDYLLIIRKPRGPTKRPQDQPEQRVKAVKQPELAGAIAGGLVSDLLIVPIGAKFADIQRRIAVLYGE